MPDFVSAQAPMPTAAAIAAAAVSARLTAAAPANKVSSFEHTYLHTCKCQCQWKIYIAHNYKASNALCMLVKREKKFSGPVENCQRNMTDLTGSLVASSRLPVQLQKRPID